MERNRRITSPERLQSGIPEVIELLDDDKPNIRSAKNNKSDVSQASVETSDYRPSCKDGLWPDMYKAINIEPQNKTKLNDSLNREITYIRITNRSDMSSFKFALVTAHKCAKTDLPSRNREISDYIFRPKNDGINNEGERKNNSVPLNTVNKDSTQRTLLHDGQAAYEPHHSYGSDRQPYKVNNEVPISSYGTTVQAVECNTCGQLFKEHEVLLRHVEQTHINFLKPTAVIETHSDNDSDVEILSTVTPQRTDKSTQDAYRNKAITKSLMLLSQFPDQNRDSIDATDSRPSVQKNSYSAEHANNCNYTLSGLPSTELVNNHNDTLSGLPSTELANNHNDKLSGLPSTELVNNHNDTLCCLLSTELANNHNDKLSGLPSTELVNNHNDTLCGLLSTEPVNKGYDLLRDRLTCGARVSKSLTQPLVSHDPVLAAANNDVKLVNIPIDIGPTQSNKEQANNDVKLVNIPIDTGPTQSNKEQASANDVKLGDGVGDDIDRSIKVEADSDSNYVPHMDVDGNPSSRVSCPECPNTYSSKWGLKRHMKRAHKDKTMSREERGTFKCGDCSNTYADKWSLKRHVKRAHSSKDKTMVEEERGTFKCGECSNVYAYRTDLKHHTKREHNKDKIDGAHESGAFECRECSNVYAWRKSLIRHMKRAHPLVTGIPNDSVPDHRFACTECEKSYKYKYDLKKHVKRAHCRVENNTENESTMEIKPEIHSSEKHDTEDAGARSSAPVTRASVGTVKTSKSESFDVDLRSDASGTDIEVESDDNEDADPTWSSKEIATAGDSKIDDIDDDTNASNEEVKSNNDGTVRLPEAISVMKSWRKQIRFACPKCTNTYVLKKSLKAHMKRAHGKKLNKEPVDSESAEKSRSFSCSICSSVYEYKTDLYKHMQEVHANLKNDWHVTVPSRWSSFKCYKCNNIFNNKEELVLHLQACNIPDTNNCETSNKQNDTEMMAELYTCGICCTAFSNRQALKKHEIVKHRSLIKCECGKTFSREHYHGHINVCERASNADQSEETATQETVESDKVYQCALCMEKVVTPEHALQHLKKKPFSCSSCGYSITSRYRCVRHINKAVCYNSSNVKNKPVINTDIVCQACDIRFEGIASCIDHWASKHAMMLTQYVSCKICSKLYPRHTLDNHMKAVHVRSFVCDLCGNRYGTDSKLKAHQLTHEKPSFPCSECGKLFKRKRSLQRHIRDIHNTKQKSTFCDICGNGFKSVHTLEIHKSTMHTAEEDKAFSCSMCEKKFALAYMLKKHISVHVAVKTVQCPQCPKLFASKHRLYNHIKTHSTTRQFACHQCSAAFKQEHHLQAHMLKHTGARDFACDLCDKRFSRKQILQTHRLSHTGERPYSCNECSKTFITKTSLNRHMREKHEVEGNTLYVEISADQTCV